MKRSGIRPWATLRPSGRPRRGGGMARAGRAGLGTLGVLAMLASATGCGRRPAPAAPPAEGEAEAAIAALLLRYQELSNATAADSLATLYAEDAILVPPDAAIVEGREAIRAFWRDGIEGGITFERVRTVAHGTSGWVAGRYQLEATDEQAADSGKFLMTVERQADRAWRITADSWNTWSEGAGEDAGAGEGRHAPGVRAGARPGAAGRRGVVAIASPPCSRAPGRAAPWTPSPRGSSARTASAGTSRPAGPPAPSGAGRGGARRASTSC